MYDDPTPKGQQTEPRSIRVPEPGSGQWDIRKTALRRSLALALLALCILGCFDSPIRQRLHLVFGADGSLRTVLEVHLERDGVQAKATQERLRRQEESLLQGESRWHRRFDAMQAAVDETSWRKEKGLLRRFVRSAEVDHPDLLEPESALQRFWVESAIFPTYTYDPQAGIAELSLFVGISDRASRREARQMEELVGNWSELLLAYFERLDELYRYLDQRPDRAVVCFANLMEHGLDLPPIGDREERLTEAVLEAMDAVLEIFLVEDGETLEEISRRVFDPFPAEMTVVLPSAPLEVEGFEVARQGGRVGEGTGERLTVPGLSLWSAYTRLENHWLAPDPLLRLLAAERADNEGAGGEALVDPRALANLSRRSQLPLNAGEVEDTLYSWLTPAEVYRARWRVQPADPEASSAEEAP